MLKITASDRPNMLASIAAMGGTLRVFSGSPFEPGPVKPLTWDDCQVLSHHPHCHSLYPKVGRDLGEILKPLTTTFIGSRADAEAHFRLFLITRRLKS